MIRLYNEYSASPHEGNTELIHKLIDNVAKEIWDHVVVGDNVCPRDVESVCHGAISSFFAENILRRAMKKRKEEKTKKTLTSTQYMIPYAL